MMRFMYQDHQNRSIMTVRIASGDSFVTLSAGLIRSYAACTHGTSRLITGEQIRSRAILASVCIEEGTRSCLLAIVKLK